MINLITRAINREARGEDHEQKFDNCYRKEGSAEPLASDAAVQPRSHVEQDEAHTSPISASSPRGGVASFGPFRLHVTERLLEKNGVPVNIGSRALNILFTLLAHAP